MILWSNQLGIPQGFRVVRIENPVHQDFHSCRRVWNTHLPLLSSQYTDDLLGIRRFFFDFEIMQSILNVFRIRKEERKANNTEKIHRSTVAEINTKLMCGTNVCCKDC